MATWIRRLVSKNKRRFQDGPHGFDLDLAYISPRIIAMGLPAEGKDVLYRNPLPEIARFLRTYHRGHAKVYNLCSEHSYSPEKLLVPLEHYPFDDHQTPALCVVQQFCCDAAAWLAADPHNVVAVHCKAGKGRTGVMICCLLLYLHINAPALANLPAGSSHDSSQGDSSKGSGSSSKAEGQEGGLLPVLKRLSRSLSVGANTLSPDDAGNSCSSSSSGDGSGLDAAVAAELAGSGAALWHPWQSVEPVQLQRLARPAQEVLDLYAERRTHDGNGVSIPSQRRYVGYFWSVLSGGPKPLGSLPRPRTLQLRELLITGLPAGIAEQCVVVVEARPSGSTAASASRVFFSAARKPPAANVPGLCMGPCVFPPQVQDDSCTVITSPAGDSLTIRLPAASMGLSPLARSNSMAAELHMQQKKAHGGAVPAGAADSSGTAAPVAPAAADASAAGAGASCSCFAGGCVGSCCSCLGGAAVAPSAAADAAAAPAAVSACTAAGSTSAPAVAAPSAGLDVTCSVAGCSIEELSDIGDQLGCCVVEGDVRLLVLKGGVRLFYSWFNTAYLPAGGCYKLSRHQLDKPFKALPHNLSLTVKYVDMQPAVNADGAEEEDAEDSVELQHQQQQQEESFDSMASNIRQPGSKARGGPAAGSGKQQQYHQQQQQQKQQQQHAGSAASTAAPAALVLAGSKSSDTLSSAGVTDGNAAGPQLQRRQQQQQHGGSASAPASPQASGGSREARNTSWRYNLPSISSISTSALGWGSGVVKEDEEESAGEVGVPHFWDWDWDSLAAATSAANEQARSKSAAGAAAVARDAHQTLADQQAAGATASVQQQQQKQQQVRTVHGTAGLQAKHQHTPFAEQQRKQDQQSQGKQQQQPQQQQQKLQHSCQGAGQARSNLALQQLQQQQQQRTRSSNSNGTSRATPHRAASQQALTSQLTADIELPTFSWRPASAAAAAAAAVPPSSTVDALLDPAVTVTHGKSYSTDYGVLAGTGVKKSDPLFSGAGAAGSSAFMTAAAGHGIAANGNNGVVSSSSANTGVGQYGVGSSSGMVSSKSRSSFSSLWQLLQQTQQLQQSLRQQQQQKDAQHPRRGSAGVAAAAVAASAPVRPKMAGVMVGRLTLKDVREARDSCDGGSDSISDDGDVYGTDLLGLSGDGSSSPLLPAAASPSAVAPDVLPASPDALHGLLEALNWGTDSWRHQGVGAGSGGSSIRCTSSASKQQQRRQLSAGVRATVSSPVSASSSRAGSPVAHSAAADSLSAPATPPPHSAVGTQDVGCKDSAPNPQSPTSLLDLNEEVDVGAVVSFAKGQGKKEHQGVVDWGNTGVEPQPALPAAAVAQMYQPAAVQVPCCLDCVFDLHIGPCPSAAVAEAATITTRSAKAAAPGGRPVFLPTPAFAKRLTQASNNAHDAAEAAALWQPGPQHAAIQPCGATTMSSGGRPSSTAGTAARGVRNSADRAGIVVRAAGSSKFGDQAQRSTCVVNAGSGLAAAAVPASTPNGFFHHCSGVAAAAASAAPRAVSRAGLRSSQPGAEAARPALPAARKISGSGGRNGQPSISWYGSGGGFHGDGGGGSSVNVRRTISSPSTASSEMLHTAHGDTAVLKGSGNAAQPAGGVGCFASSVAGDAAAQHAAAAPAAGSLTRAWSTNAAAVAAAAAHASRASAAPAAPTVAVDSSNHSVCSSGSSSRDELLQGLLQAADDRAVCSSSNGSCGRESVATLVHRWEQLEQAWQRSWWV